MRKKRALSSEAARAIRQRGHDDALEFALAIGLGKDYQNDRHAKKDVIDQSGDSHSVKSGEKKWQVFLYGRGRFKTDDAFGTMSGIGDLLIACIDSFPTTYSEYVCDKAIPKEKLRLSMRSLAEKLQDKRRLRAFLNKSLFNGGEVNYLTVKHEGIFHVFLNTDVITALSENIEVCNSSARQDGQVPEQKVLFRHNGKNLGELEMRNDSEGHYKEIRFNMLKPKVMGVLFSALHSPVKLTDKILVYGNAVRRFGRWDKGFQIHLSKSN